MTDREQAILSIIRNPALTRGQAMAALAMQAENLLEPCDVPPGFAVLERAGVISDPDEGRSPHTPRCILPDYAKFLREGSAFLRLPPPEDLYNAVTALLILYRYVPSNTHFPLYAGRLDEMLEPFVQKESDKTARRIIGDLMLQADRAAGDPRCHCTIGPHATRTGRIVLSCLRQMQSFAPGITLRYAPKITPDDFAADCAATALRCEKPVFVNHRMCVGEFGEDYGVAERHSILPVGGGAFTLARLTLSRLAESAASSEDFFLYRLPHAVEVMCGFMNSKIRFLMEQSSFFQSSFFVSEGLVHRDRFTGLVSVSGLPGCVDRLMELDGKAGRFGSEPDAGVMGVRVMNAVEQLVAARQTPFCRLRDHAFLLQADNESGVDADGGPVFRRSEPYSDLRRAGIFHAFFPAGTGDRLPFDGMALHNPNAVVDLVKGAFAVGMRSLQVCLAAGETAGAD